ncbi:hypothetical protein FNV43_RR11301 [Rhamnella rubrinervis]|uniref:Uncharacterized protein n=1 Tax=Rhamnella rubrinervis TaxID=2594499 RepID=A0A8K0MHL2_9ROSA|nr:hypothetical protein FNV43_RR11301 [Rhamnella rubrinervis]
MAPDNLQAMANGIVVARCYCCGLTEECTFSYIARVRERFGGRWICGLCTEAVNEEALRLDVCIEQAVNQHMKFRQQFKSSNPPAKATEDLILVMKQVLRRSLDVPGGNQSCRPLSRAKSCFATMAKK